MKAYILQITRGIRAERPSKEQIIVDSAAADIGNEAGVSQDKTKDNFFNLARDMNLQQNVNRILSVMSFNPFAMTMGDGWRVLDYPHSDKWTQDYTQKSSVSQDLEGNDVTTYAEVWVQYTTEPIEGEPMTSGGTEQFTGPTALTDAETFIATLNASDGWVLGQEWGRTIVIDSRPSLWVYEDYVPLNGSRVNPALGRTDTDRW